MHVNRLIEACVKARYARHYEIGDDALIWLGQRTIHLLELVEQNCLEHLEHLRRKAAPGHR